MKIQSNNRGLEKSISGLLLRIFAYDYLYVSLYCLANSFLTQNLFFPTRLLLTENRLLHGPRSVNRYTEFGKIRFTKDTKDRVA